MFDSMAVILIFCAYMALLLLGALWLLNKSSGRRRVLENPTVYALSLAVYCTSWTYYGSVGSAVNSGMLFLTIYLGPTLTIVLGWRVLRKLVRIRNTFHTTSIADFISARYNKSQVIAAIATLGAFIGILPYVALQLKSVISTFEVLTEGGGTQIVTNHVGPIVVALMVFFTIIFGVRHLDSTERHPGMVLVIVIESVVKLIAFLAAGFFITYFAFDGFGDIFQRFSEHEHRQLWNVEGTPIGSYVRWSSYLLLAMSAILFLPRQFHLAVVENSRERNIATAMWLFPLYLLLINLFVLPIALGGVLSGLPREQADTFVLRLPMLYDLPWLALLVFLGGVSAATSMIMITSMTMATMMTNHLMLPVINWLPKLGFLRRHLLKCRWAAVTLFILLGYWFEKYLVESSLLINIGIISFGAALQFAPSILGGIFWSRGSKSGCLWGMSAGFLVWGYTMLLPAFVQGGWLPSSLLETGPWGMTFLRPEGLLGLNVLDPVSHTVFWSLLFNIGLYVTVSLYGRRSQQEQRQVEEFFSVLSSLPQDHGKAWEATISMEEKSERIYRLFNMYWSYKSCRSLINRCMSEAHITGKKMVSIMEFAEFHNRVESTLAGAIGSAAAHLALRDAEIFTPKETKELTVAYSEILARMKVKPDDLKNRIDYFKEKERLLVLHAAELEEKIHEREQEIDERHKVEEALEAEKERLAVTLRSIGDGVITTDIRGKVVLMNPVAESLTGWSQEKAMGKPLDDIFRILDERTEEPLASPTDEVFRSRSVVQLPGSTLVARDSESQLVIASSAAPIVDRAGKVIGAVLVFRNITEKRRWQESLLKARKLESIGVLAGGIAHDFNNLLTGILNHIYLGKMNVNPDDDVYDNLEETEKATLRAQALTQQLLTFSKGGAPVKKTASIADLIVDCAEFALRGSNVRPEFTLSDPLWLVDVDEGQINQVIQNLVLNGAQAMPGGGCMEIRAENVTIDTPPDPSMKPGHHVKLTVHDHGHGIPPKNLSKIFDPYYTTKKTGQGLGLFIAYSIIEKHGGQIAVTSEVGKGTTFSIYLPASNKEAEDQLDVTQESMIESGRILIMDDERVIRYAMKTYLSHLGFDAVCTQNGEEALALFQDSRDRSEPFDLVIMDLTIPGGIGGKEAVEKMREIDPSIKAIVSSGYSNDPVLADHEKYGFCGILKKPFNMDDLYNEIQRVLVQV